MVKIVNLESANRRLILPELGETTIPDDGVVEVSEDTARALVESHIGWSYEGVENVIQDTESVMASDSEPSAELSEKELIFQQLEQLSLDELVTFAREQEMPEKDWAKFAKNESKPKELMIGYLKKKL